MGSTFSGSESEVSLLSSGDLLCDDSDDDDELSLLLLLFALAFTSFCDVDELELLSLHLFYSS